MNNNTSSWEGFYPEEIRAMWMLALGCGLHPAYRGLRRSKVACETCNCLYDAKMTLADRFDEFVYGYLRELPSTIEHEDAPIYNCGFKYEDEEEIITTPKRNSKQRYVNTHGRNRYGAS